MNTPAAPEPSTDFGLRLQRLRKLNRVSLADVARQSGLSRGYLTSVEAGRIEIGSAMYRRISKAIDDLARDKPKP